MVIDADHRFFCAKPLTYSAEQCIIYNVWLCSFAKGLFEMTDEQKKRLAELAAKQKDSAREREISRIKAQMREEIPNFSERYTFADSIISEKLGAFIGGLPFLRPAWIDIKKFRRRRDYSPNEADGKCVWICFLSGSAELFDIYVGCTAADYFADFDDWQFYSPFTVLAYDDLGGFVFIDDNGSMTEIIL